MSGDNNAVITREAREKLVKARAGAIQLPKIVGMAFGNGGVDADGLVIPPSELRGGLFNEIFRKGIDRYSFPAGTVCRYECTLTEDELAGYEISEIGLYDDEGDLVCIKTFKGKGKDAGLEMTFQVEDEF